MKKLIINCEVLTPMFMGGADGKRVELRSMEFKGMMRFWWRAIRALGNLKNLKEDEEAIFGGVNEKAGGSKVKLRVYPQPNPNDIGNDLKNYYKLDWSYNSKTRSLSGDYAGIGYLLYSVTLRGRERSFIKDGFGFNIEISSFYGDALKKAVAALWASLYLGGFGTRSRRGGGNVKVVKVDGETFGLEFFINEINSNEIGTWLKKNLKRCIEIINGNRPSIIEDYSNLSNSSIIVSKNPFNDWKLALNDIGEIYANFRQSNRSEIFKTAIFGLPVIHSGDRKIEGENSDRRGSPMIIKILYSNGKYYWLVLKLTGGFLKPGENLVLMKKRGNNWEVEQKKSPTFELFDNFWEVLKSNGIEFKL